MCVYLFFLPVEFERPSAAAAGESSNTRRAAGCVPFPSSMGEREGTAPSMGQAFTLDLYGPPSCSYVPALPVVQHPVRIWQAAADQRQSTQVVSDILRMQEGSGHRQPMTEVRPLRDV